VRRSRVLGAAALLALAACAPGFGSPRTQVQAPLGADFALRRGQTAGITGEAVTVTFVRVAEDSRCPAGVQCIRAGEARVELRLRLPGREPEEVLLVTPVEPRRAEYGDFDVHLVRLEPLPSADGRRPRYTAILRVTKRP
jgi:hypothetical protein